jgi:tetratricopeptide (TPR) repeat protein
VSPQRWNHLKSLYGQALDLNASERSHFVAQLSDTDSGLAGELQQLLERADEGSWLRSPLHPPPGVNAEEPAHFFPPGYELGGRYRIDSFLGSGGMGEVYRAFDQETAESIAIKILRGELASQPEFGRRLKRELNLARRIPHVNICRVFDLQRAPSPQGPPVVFLTMELLNGETLDARIRRGPLPLDEARSIAYQLFDGLSSAHAKGIVHRDMKDGNVMLVPGPDGKDRAVITDFGLAREQESSAATGSVFATGAIVGTAAYMAPEQLEGKPVTTAVDIHGLGVILFKMVTGRLPFEGDTALAVALRRLRSPAPSPREFVKDLDRCWEHAILACLEADPARRPQTPEEVRKILEGKPGRYQVPGRRWFVLAGATAICSIVAGTMWLQPKAPGALAVRHFKLAEEFVKRRSAEDLRNAVQEYQRALDTEPEYGDAWAGMADAWAAIANFSLGDSREALRKARVAAEKAVRLNNRSARAVGVLGYCISIDVDTWLSAEPYLRRAVELDPRQPNTRLWYGSFLGKTGRSQAAIAQIQAGLQEEPMSFALNQQLTAEYLRIGENRKALDSARELVRLQQFQGIGYLAEARAYEALGQYEDGIRACGEAAKYMSHPDVDAVRASLLAARGDRAEALRIAARLDDLWRQGNFDSQLLAKLYAKLGDNHRALDILRAGVDRREASLVGSLLSPVFRALFDDPGFVQLIRRVGLDPALLKAYRQ